VLAFLQGSTIVLGQETSNRELIILEDLLDRDPVRVIETIDSIFSVENPLSVEDQVSYHLIHSDAHYYNEDIYKSTISLYKALTLMPKDFDTEKKIEAYNNLGQNLSTLGKNDSAIAYYQRGLLLAKKNRDSIEIGNLYYNIGVEYMMVANYKKQLNYLDSAYQISLEILDSNGIGSALLMTGTMKEAHYDQKGAIETYKKALKYVTSEDPTLTCQLHTNIGGAFMYMELLDSAQFYVDLATNCFENKEDQTAFGYVYEVKAAISRDLGDTTQAIDWINKGIDWAKKVGDVRYFYALKALDLEINIENQTLSNVETLLEEDVIDFYPDRLIFIYELYATLLDKAGKDKEAKEALLKLLKLQRKRMNEDNQRVVQGQAVKYGLFEKEKELELANANYQIKESRWRNYVLGVVFLFLLLLGTYYYYYKRKILLKEQEKLKKEKELLEKIVRIEGQALRAQMNPHFIFNALNSIKGLVVTKKNREAALYISKFSKLVRNVLDNSREQYITLEKEINTLETYIQLEQARFRDGFSYEIILNESINSAHVLILPALIQPFVENAIWHGFKQNPRVNTLKIIIEKKETWLWINIEDNGVGRAQTEEQKAQKVSHQSHGVAITASRIENNKINNQIGSITYYDLEDDSNQSIGTRVVLQLPIQYLTNEADKSRVNR
jgi:tetratricopeptide (TPR) repeat protein